MSKRTIATIKQFDYTSKEEFENDIKTMKSKGYVLTDGMGYNLNSQALEGDDKWKYTAYFIKSDLV